MKKTEYNIHIHRYKYAYSYSRYTNFHLKQYSALYFVKLGVPGPDLRELKANPKPKKIRVIPTCRVRIKSGYPVPCRALE